jgi:uncharacterized integral membrane protein (TIGR00698 family)
MATVGSAERLRATATTPATGQLRPITSEDWLAVAIGFLILLAALAGVRPQLPALAWATASDLVGNVLSSRNLLSIGTLGILMALLSTTRVLLMQGSVPRFLAAFPVIYLLGTAAQLAAGSAAVASWGFEYVIFAFAFGLVVSNTLGVPDWLREGAQTEFYIKTGLVILGSSIVFDDLMQAGLLGLAQAVLVVTAVWFACFRFAKWLRVDDEFATMLASAVSICGVSAAIATCGAIQGDRKKLSYVTSLVLVVAAPMMVLMPLVVKAFGIPEAVGGAWLGGTLDTSATVVAAGEMISASARNAGVVVKLSQNVLIGIAAFLLTIWWTMRNRGPSAERPSAGVIWERFPKFVLGFIAASLLFSFLVDSTAVRETRGLLTGLRTAWFALAFASIGLETRFSELMKPESGRAAVAFLGGQAFNVVWTLLLAYLLFGGILVAVPQFQ